MLKSERWRWVRSAQYILLVLHLLRFHVLVAEALSNREKFYAQFSGYKSMESLLTMILASRIDAPTSILQETFACIAQEVCYNFLNRSILLTSGPDSDFEYSTQSYTGFEPTSMRAIRARYKQVGFGYIFHACLFSPYIQTVNRLAQLKQLGHSIDKVEFIIMGGTFMSLDKNYRDDFISKLHDALSGHSSTTVAEAVKFSEVSDTKCIGITIETRPDYCLPRHMDDMLSYGCTRLEIGVQSIYEDVARDTNRGHTVQAVCECFHFAKDTGYKVVIHMMPNLPNVPLDRDLEQVTLIICRMVVHFILFNLVRRIV